MALTLENFQVSIQKKFFVSLESLSDTLSFTGLNDFGSDLRSIATNANVIVFLPKINKIFARGTYFGVNLSEYEDTINNINTSIGTLTDELSELSTLVDSHDDTITNHIDLLETITSDITDLKRDIEGLDPDNPRFTEIVQEAVSDALEDQLEVVLGSSQTISNINQYITNILNDLNDKAEKEEFDNLVTKLGIQQWNWIPEENLLPGQQNVTIVDALTDLTEKISGIPHFAIEVVDKLPTTDISQTTIYLKRSGANEDPNNNEIFTEYIYVNLDKYQKDPETGESLPERWGWERLGCQYFNITNYLELSNEDFERIKASLEDSIAAIQYSLEGKNLEQIEANKNNITDLQTDLGNLEYIVTQLTNRLNILLDSQGNFKLTGSVIKTSNDEHSDTIANDISNLKTSLNNINNNSLEWIILDGNT